MEVKQIILKMFTVIESLVVALTFQLVDLIKNNEDYLYIFNVHGKSESKNNTTTSVDT